MEKPTLPKGTRDFGPAQMAKRQFIFENIRKVFQKYGFQPLETPAMENLSTLTGKYGEEGDQLLFRIMESGEAIKPLKIRLHGYEVTEFNKINKDYLLIVKPLIQEAFYSSFDNGFAKAVIENELRNRINSNYFERIKAPIDKAELLINLLRTNIEDLSIQIAEEGAYMIFTGANKEQLPKYFEQFEKNYLNTIFLDKIANFILASKPYDVGEELRKTKTRDVTHLLSEKGLRYDLTVPFARYVVMNRHEITFPFKRYQIQPVWRADRPQKGRYREFYQCDADVVGTDSLICEAEIVLMIKEVFKALGIQDYTIKINHRGVLSGLAELAGARENQMALFVAIDKLDKIGEEKVREELAQRGFNPSSINIVFDLLNFKGTTQQKIGLLEERFKGSEIGQKGVKDLKEVFQLLSDYGVDNSHVEFDVALARGLSYYTGCIFEVKINNVAIGSVSGGGRYDNLTGVFDSKDKNSGVGISFGVDRLYDAMEELKLFPAEAQVSSKVLLCHFDSECKRFGLNILQQLRQHGIASEIYPDGVKIQKQLDYANKKMIPYTIVIGSDEVKSGSLAFKNMKSGEQQKLNIQDIIQALV